MLRFRVAKVYSIKNPASRRSGYSSIGMVVLTSADGGLMDRFETLLVLIAIVVVYFFPAMVAARRNHHQNNAIFMLNLLLGWTVIGWMAAFIWAVSAVRRKTEGGP